MNTTRGMAAGLMLAACVVAQSERRVQVRCADVAGKAVEGAEVWVWQSRRMPDGSGKLISKGPFRTGADGAVPTVVAMTNAGGNFDRWVYARVAGKLVGAIRAASFTGQKDADDIALTLYPSREVHGKVTVPDGVDPSTVTIRTLALNGAIDDNWWAQPFPRQSSISSFTDTLPEIFDAKAGADGTFTLKDLPAKPLLYLAAEGKGLGQAQWFNAVREGRDIPAVIEMRLYPEAVVSGIAYGPNERPLANANVALQRLEGGVQTTWSTITDAEGRYRFDGLAQGKHRLKITTTAGVMRPVDLSLVRGKPTVGQDLDVEAGVLVRGVVRNEAGEPVESVGIGVVDPDPWGNRLYLGNGRTDPQGRFEIRLPTGPARLYFNGLPKGYAYPKPQMVAEIDVEEGSAPRALELVVKRAR